jgi:HEPN domain-containing protein
MKNSVVDLWMMKAANDLKIGKDEIVTENPAVDMVCFHMQQCVEKCLKAFLVKKGKEITKTHNLSLILQECIEIDSSFKSLMEAGADELTAYAVGTRYPDDFYLPTIEESQKAIIAAEKVKAFVLEKISA